MHFDLPRSRLEVAQKLLALEECDGAAAPVLASHKGVHPLVPQAVGHVQDCSSMHWHELVGAEALGHAAAGRCWMGHGSAPMAQGSGAPG